MKKLFLTLSTLLSSLLINTASASIIGQYNVSSASSDTCAGSPHGLWTHSVFSGTACANYFDISGLFTQYDDGTASLIATAQNPADLSATTINIALGDYNATTGIDGYKQEYGLPFDPDNVDFYNSITGNIEISSDIFAENNARYEDISFFRHSFQFGLGADGYNKDGYGASAWICPFDNCNGDEHWDFNLAFTPVSVPEPSSLMLLAIAVLGLGLRRKKK